MISSPVHSFVNFNDPTTYCGEQLDYPLPAPVGVGFQFLIDEIVSDVAGDWTLGICDEGCNLLTANNLLTADVLCYWYYWIRTGYEDQFFPATGAYPVTILDCGDGVPPFLPEGTVYATEDDLFAAISEGLGITVTNADDIRTCCRLREVCIRMEDNNGIFYSTYLQEAISSAYFNDLTFDVSLYVANRECFRYCIYFDGVQVGCSNLFQRVDELCNTTTIKYYCDDTALGFSYQNGAYNLARIPILLATPTFPTEKNVYKRSDGTYRTNSAVIEKEWLVRTDWFPEWLHGWLVIALAHDHFFVTNTDSGIITATELTNLGDYDIQWEYDKSKVYAPAEFKLRIPIAGINRNCRSTTACCVPGSVTIEYTDPEVGTGNIYFAVGDNSTAVQVRYRLSTETAWTTEAIWATASPYEFLAAMPITACGGLYYEVQIRSVCNSVYSPWSDIILLYHPDPCSYPEVTSIVGYANSGGGFVINLAEDDLIDSYDYEVLNSALVVVATGNTTGQTINVAIGTAADTYTFSITANCGDTGGCEITGEATYSPYNVTTWETTEV